MAEEKDDIPDSPEIHFEPLVQLPQIEIRSLEEDEQEMLKLRAKLFRFDSASEAAEWKERGTGEVKLLKHKKDGLVRVLMRRDKTLKLCANHYIMPWMELKPNCGSDRAWVWNTTADFADEEAKAELLAIRFANAENAQKFKEKFDEAKAIANVKVNSKQNGVTGGEEKNAQSGSEDQPKKSEEEKSESADEDTDKIVEQLDDLTVKDKDTSASDKTTEDKNSSKTDDGSGDQKE
ncbi:hypothetical protein ScPMuIL_005449 [Solemya velum]